MKISVTGFNGRLGSELVRRGCSPLDCDITDVEEVEASVLDQKPDVIINCAAYTNVDKCEQDEEYKTKAIPTNTFGVNNLREVFSGYLIHISTDYIFKGDKGPYKESSTDYHPVNSYGLTKLGGEMVLQNHPNQDFTIVRTTGLYGSPNKDDFAGFLISLFEQGNPFTIAQNVVGNQTYIPYLADTLLRLIELPNPPRYLNIASKDVLSRYDFALMLANVFGYDVTLVSPANVKFPAKRPTKGGLKTDLAKKLGLPIYTVLDGLKEYKDKINE